MASRPRGNQTVYSQATADLICRRLASGESLRAICREEGMPPESTVREWVLDDREGFAAQYTRARELQAHSMAEEIFEIVDDGNNDWMERNGQDNPGWTLNGEHVSRSRMRFDARRWYLSKVLPKIYGEKIVQEHTGKDGGPIETKQTVVDAGTLSPEERAALRVVMNNATRKQGK